MKVKVTSTIPIYTGELELKWAKVIWTINARVDARGLTDMYPKVLKIYLKDSGKYKLCKIPCRVLLQAIAYPIPAERIQKGHFRIIDGHCYSDKEITLDFNHYVW